MARDKQRLYARRNVAAFLIGLSFTFAIAGALSWPMGMWLWFKSLQTIIFLRIFRILFNTCSLLAPFLQLVETCGDDKSARIPATWEEQLCFRPDLPHAEVFYKPSDSWGGLVAGEGSRYSHFVY